MDREAPMSTALLLCDVDEMGEGATHLDTLDNLAPINLTVAGRNICVLENTYNITK